jgi:cellulose synthase/poly-beta-1,6-N-acetylglucosamine synthase-like glycosyltransferase
MAEPAVSVVIPTYNRARSLDRLLTALAACDMPAGGAEVIVVDDGSSDDTGDVVRASAVGARYVRQENRGPAAARNTGWRLARAPVVAFTDDDTLPDRRWLVDLLAELSSHPELAAVGGRVLPLRRGFMADYVQLDRVVGHGADERGVRFLITANAAYRTEVLRDVDGFDERFPMAAGEDTDLSFRVTRNGGRLGVTTSAMVLHDHRTGVRDLLRTYYRNGISRHRLAGRHPDLAVSSSARLVTRWRYWPERYRYYRQGGDVSRLRSLSYVGLRVAGLVSYGAGLVVANRRNRWTP